jgi:DNA-binding beta-propeller fold protein YncE
MSAIGRNLPALRPGPMARVALLAVAATLATACGTGGAPALDLRKVDVIALPGKGTRFDYMSLDQARQLLVLAHLGDDEVVGVDTGQRRVAWRAGGVGSAHGVAVDTNTGRAYATATATNEVVALDEASGRELFRSPTGRFPDGVAVDPVSGTVWVSNKDSGSETVVDAASGRAVATLAVGADTGNVLFDASSHQMVVAVGQSNELVVIDAAGASISRRLPLPGCRGAHGLAVKAGTVFVACEDNADVVAVDLGSGRISGTGSTGTMPDVLAFDAARERLYVAAEDGVVAAFDTQGGGLALRGKAKAAGGAHTVAVDPTTGRVYLPLPNIGGHPGPEILEPLAQRD